MLISIRPVETHVLEINRLQLPQWELLVSSDYA
jgi:hypothetical protein